MHTMFDKILGVALILCGVAGIVYLGDQVLIGQDTITQNTTVLTSCNAGQYWCSGQYMSDLVARNELIGFYSGFFALFIIVCVMATIGGVILMWSARSFRVQQA